MIEEGRPQASLVSTSKRVNWWTGEMIKSHSMHEQISLNCIVEDGSAARSSTLRQTQQLSLIKDRFKRMIELQNRSFLERNQLHREREAILQEQQSQARTRANRVKDQRVPNGEATRSWRVRNMREAAVVREGRLRNEWTRAKRDIDELKGKQSMVSDRHKSFLTTHAKPFFLEAKTDPLLKRRLKVGQEYRCGLIREMSCLMDRM